MQFQALLQEVKSNTGAIEKKKLEEVEQRYFIWKATGKVPAGGSHDSHGGSQSSSLTSEIAAARKRVGDILKEVTTTPGGDAGSGKDGDRISKLEKDNATMRQELNDLRRLVDAMRLKIDELSGTPGSKAPVAQQAAAKPKAAAKESDDEDVDLFGSDDEEEDAEKARIREERLKAYADKKGAKPGLIAKSSVVLDVKPWDDETDMAALEKAVRSVQMDGLVWGASKLVPVGYGIKKLQIMCVVEDEKVSVEELAEKIQEFEDFIQSVDIAAFNKI